jgi:hypothetical protein
MNIKHSDAYGVYGMKRTGCAGCPFDNQLEIDLKAIEIWEPKLYKGISNIFKISYEWTRKYREFVKNLKEDKREIL